ncbi:MAG: PHP domain-containing protein [Thermomicrobiales bacterium]|nr:PHP domain-containing protein [Thermomicrobiales bacterium]
MSTPGDHPVDLHTHSTYSDGLLSPAALVAEAAARGVRFLGLTDHDTVAGIPEAQQAGAALGVEVIPGVELSTSLSGGEDIHLLGYYVDGSNAELLAGLAAFAAARQERAARILARLREIGLALDAEEVYAQAGHGTIGRPHIARALVAAGYATDLPDAFSRLIGRHKPAYIPRPRVDPRDAIALVKAAGGVPVLAHPFSPGGVEGVLDRLIPAGLLGMEVDYGEYSPEDRATLGQIARRRGLIATGGSDFHGVGVGSPYRVLGGPPVPLAAVENLRAAARSQRQPQ